MKKMSLIMLLAILFIGCSQSGRQAEDDHAVVGSKLKNVQEQAFLNNIAALCGQTFAGGETFIAEGRESWAQKQFIMHVTVCEDDHVYVPFHLDDDHSRTWMFLVEDGRLRFRHDHRHEDGTPEDVTMYGGYADGEGSAFMQNFPADEYTCDMLPTSCNAEWRVIISEDLSTFTYQLLNFGELLFEGAFDISNPVNE